MKFRHAAAATLLLGLAPQAAHSQTARIAPVLSTTMQRTCESETSSLQLINGGREVTDGQPTIENQTRVLRVTRIPGGYLFEQTVNAPGGDTLLRFNVTPNGAASDAALSGSAIDAYAVAAPQIDLSVLAAALSEDVPERLLIGRSLAVGDSYYPADLQRSLMGRMTTSLGLPFPVDGFIDIRYRGEVTHAGRRTWRFTGPMTVQGAGNLNGQPISIAQTTQNEVFHDVETGLVLSFRAEAETRLNLDGQPFQAARNTDAYQCRLIPQQA